MTSRLPSSCRAAITAAISALNPQVLTPGGTVTLNILDGVINEPGAILLTSSFGKQILIQSQHSYNFSLSSVVSSSGSAGAWTYTVQATSSVSSIAVGDYVTIYGLSGGTNPSYIAGVWPVTAVNTGSNQVTFTTTGRQSSAMRKGRSFAIERDSRAMSASRSRRH